MKDRDFKWPNPMPSAEFPSHFMTFLEVPNVDNNSLKTGDEGMPYSLSIGSCPYCQSFIFFSPTEKDRHLKIFHHNMKGDGNNVWKKDLRCLLILKNDDGVGKRCGLLFQNDNQLRMHKSQTGHKIERKRKKRTTAQAKSGKQ